MARDKPLTQQMRAFCKHWLGRHCFAPFTGQDGSGWHAFCYLLEMWGRSDTTGRHAAMIAMKAVLAGVQSKEDVHQIFVQTIPGALDWGYTAEIWPALDSPFTNVWPVSDPENTANRQPLRSVP